MEARMTKLHHHIDSIISYLSPLLSITNCHMVEFFTQRHWERLLPAGLRNELDEVKLDEGVENFWKYTNSSEDTRCSNNSELNSWICKSRAHYLKVNGDYCLSTEQLRGRIAARGGDVTHDIRLSEFMNNKKSYEVETMSSLVASLTKASGSSICVEVGGGRGHLLAALCLGYDIPCLTVDCDSTTLRVAEKRIALIQKQWHSIARKIKNGAEERICTNINKNLHRFTNAYITQDSDLRALVNETFPEYNKDDIKILLTGLHTCGNLGPDSLRIFTRQSSIKAVMNVPCCYHLLTESADELVDGSHPGVKNGKEGFPMSKYLRGFTIGRNARMLAAQSIDRVVRNRQLPDISLLYRALLQEIIKKHKPNFTVAEGRLKRISAKCGDFPTYFKMADSILKLELFDSLSDSYLRDVQSEAKWKKLVLFYLLRLCLAQVVESLILLDRLLFLMENGYENVYLVKLFDPVLSPRCHSIVAVK